MLTNLQRTFYKFTIRATVAAFRPVLRGRYTA